METDLFKINAKIKKTAFPLYIFIGPVRRNAAQFFADEMNFEKRRLPSNRTPYSFRFRWFNFMEVTLVRYLPQDFFEKLMRKKFY
jgi:hypothetical protein